MVALLPGTGPPAAGPPPPARSARPTRPLGRRPACPLPRPPPPYSIHCAAAGWPVDHGRRPGL